MGTINKKLKDISPIAVEAEAATRDESCTT